MSWLFEVAAHDNKLLKKAGLQNVQRLSFNLPFRTHDGPVCIAHATSSRHLFRKSNKVSAVATCFHRLFMVLCCTLYGALNRGFHCTIFVLNLLLLVNCNFFSVRIMNSYFNNFDCLAIWQPYVPVKGGHVYLVLPVIFRCDHLYLNYGMKGRKVLGSPK